MEMINKYRELTTLLKEDPQNGELKKEIEGLKKDFYEEMKLVFRVDKLDEFSIDGFINTFEENIFDFVEDLGGIEQLKSKTQVEPEKIAKPEQLHGYNKLSEELIELINRATKGEDINLVFSSDFDGDGVFGQIAIEEFMTVLKQLDVNINIINIEAQNTKGRGVSQSELEHPEVEKLDKVDMFITTDSNFDRDSLKGYELPKNMKNTQFRVTDHHHTNGKAPSFINKENFFEVNPHLTENPNQQTFSGAALISMILKNVLKEKEKEGLFFNTSGISNDFTKTFNNIIWTTNMGDVATNNTLLEPNDKYYEDSMEYYNLFNTLNLYKRLKVLDKESLKKQLPLEMKEDEVEELWEELELQYKKIKVLAKNLREQKKGDRSITTQEELVYLVRDEETGDLDLSDIQDLLLGTTDSFVKQKVGGRHELMSNVLKEFKKTHQKIQRKIKEVFNDTTVTTSPETSNTSFKEYDKRRGYKLISTVFPSQTETSIGFVRNYDEEGKLNRISIVGGRSQLTEGHKQGWEIFGKTVAKTLWKKLSEGKDLGKLSKTDKDEINTMIKYLGHGGAFGGYVTIPNCIEKLGIDEDKLLKMIKESFHEGITEEKTRIKEVNQENKILITADNWIDLPAILKMYERLQGYKHSSKLPNIILEIPESYKYEIEKVYQAMGLFSGEAFILNGELNPGDYVEFNMSHGALMMSNKISKEEAQKVKPYNNGEMIESPHVADLENEIQNSEELMRGVYKSTETVEVTNEPKISLDLETTGSNAKESEIYNIGIVANDGKGNLTKYSIFVNTYMPMSSIVLTRISQDFLDKHGNPNKEEIDKKIVEILDEEKQRLQQNNEKVVLSAHNGMNFDFRMTEFELPKTYDKLMNTSNFQLVDTTYLARKAMSEEVGYLIEKHNIKFQKYESDGKLNFDNWLENQLNNVEGTSEKLYNIYAEGEYFFIERGTDKNPRLKYVGKDGDKVIINNLNRENVDKFKETLKENSIPAKFSIDLITKLVATHDILYKLNEDVLKTDHKIDENIFKNLENRPATKNALRKHLSSYYFTMSKQKNVTLLLDKLKNMKMDDLDLNEAYEDTEIDYFIENLPQDHKYTLIIKEAYELDDEITNISDLIDSEEFIRLSEESQQKEEIETFIVNKVISMNGVGVDEKIIQKEYLDNFTRDSIDLKDWYEPKEKSLVDKIKKWVTTKADKAVLEELFVVQGLSLGDILRIMQNTKGMLPKGEKEENQKTEEDLRKENIVKNHTLKTSKYFDMALLPELVEEELREEMLDIQTKFLKHEENKEKAKISEDISTILYLVGQDYLINLVYEEETEEGLKEYSKALSRKTGVSEELLFKTTMFIKDIYENKHKEEYKDIHHKIEHYFKKEHHQAMEDAKAEQEVMREFLAKFYPIEGTKEKQKIHSASSELVKRTFVKKYRDDYTEKGFDRLPTKYHEADQDVFYKRLDEKELTKEDHSKLEEYLSLGELRNTALSKRKSKTEVVEKDIEEFLKKLEETDNLKVSEIVINKFRELRQIDKSIKEKNKELIKTLKSTYEETNIPVDKQEDIENYFSTLFMFENNIKDLVVEDIEKRMSEIEKDYDIVITNTEYQIITKLRNVLDKKSGKRILDLPEVSQFSKSPFDIQIDLEDETNQKAIEEELELFFIGLEKTAGFSSIADNEVLVNAIKDYLKNIINVLEASKKLSINNFRTFKKNFFAEFEKPLNPNQVEDNNGNLIPVYKKGESKAQNKKYKQLMYKHMDYITPINGKAPKQEKSKTRTP